MIRFRRLTDLTSDVDDTLFADAAQLFRAAFPYEATAIDRIETQMRRQGQLQFEPILLISLDRRRRR